MINCFMMVVLFDDRYFLLRLARGVGVQGLLNNSSISI